jgi:hypothetical protein
VIVDIVNVIGVTFFKSKYDAPVCPNSNGPKPFKVPRQAMKSEAGQVHVFRLPGSIEDGGDIFHFLSVIAADPFGFSVLK